MASNKWMMIAIIGFACACGTDDKDPQQDNNANTRTENNAGDDMGVGGDASQNSSTNNANNDNGSNGSTGTTGTNNTFDPGDCAGGIESDVTIDLDPGEFAGQFYARTAWDGEGAWVVYNRPDGAGPNAPEEIFAVRVGCDATVLSGPIRLSTANGARNYMPVIASRGGVTHVAWVEEGANPERILLQKLGQDGEPILDEPADITPSVGTEPVSGLVWEPDIAVWEDGRGAIVASAGSFGAFQIVMQRYDDSGASDGDAVTLYPEEGVDQKRPTIAADPDGTIYVAWTRYKPEDPDAGTQEEPERTVFTSIPAGASEIFPAAPQPAKPLTTPNPIARYAREPGPSGSFYLAFQVTQSGGQNILVRDGANFETADTGTFGSVGWANFRPSIASGKGGGVLAWYRYNQTPLENVVVLQPFDFDGSFEPASEITIETSTPGIPPYGPDITWANGAVYFVVWGEGTTAPDARVKGRWFLR